MKNKILLISVIVLSIIYFKGSFNKETSFFNNTVKVQDTTNEKILEYNMDEYLIGVIAGEMPISFNEEALKAQIIASRTYAYYKILNSNKDYDLKNDTSSQVFLNIDQIESKWQDNTEKYISKIKRLINDTKDLVITYNDNIIPAYYFSMSNGYTENGKNVWGENKPYLVSVPSPEDNNLKNFEYSVTFTKKEFCEILNITNCTEIKITNIKRNNTNHVDTITINRVTYKGTEFRKKLKIRSTDFTIDINSDVTIKTKGYGHGVGMSQYGANIMASEGKNYEQIIKHYYSGVNIQKINSIKI